MLVVAVLSGVTVEVSVNVEPGNGVFVEVLLGTTTVLLGVDVTVMLGVIVRVDEKVGLMVLVFVNVEPGKGVFVDVDVGSTTVDE
jgi:hypothetical protein